MATLCETYPSERAAREGIRSLRAAGVPGPSIRLLTGCTWHDVRDESAGGFAGPLAPDVELGTYGNVRRQRRQGAGAFAGDPERQRQGSFADAERDTIVSHARRGERARVAGDGAVRRLLTEVAPDRDFAERALDELHHGHVVVVAELADPRGA